MNTNIILGRDGLKQFGVWMYYDLGFIWVGNSYVKMEEDIHISSFIRLETKTIIKPQTGKLCWGKLKGNSQLSKTKLCQVLSIQENQLPGLLIINSIVKVNKKGRCPVFILNTTNKTINLQKGSTGWKLKQFKNVASLTWRYCRGMKKNRNFWKGKFSWRAINAPSVHKSTVTEMIK